MRSSISSGAASTGSSTTVCATSYVDKSALTNYADSMDRQLGFHGPVGLGDESNTPYVSGASILITCDLAERLVNARDEVLTANRYRWADDLAIGLWVANSISSTPLADMVERIASNRPATDDNTFRPMVPQNFIDFRATDEEAQTPVAGAPHYHFVTDRIHDMETFHLNHFAQRRPRIRALSAAQAERVPGGYEPDERIFVQIAAYRARSCRSRSRARSRAPHGPNSFGSESASSTTMRRAPISITYSATSGSASTR